MRYENPNVVVFGSAAVLVQQSQQDKNILTFADSPVPSPNATLAAYQADE